MMLGIGNPARGDDAAGRLVARLLHGRTPADVEIIEHNGETSSLLERIQAASVAMIVDACSAGAPTGTVHRFDVTDAPLPRVKFGLSTHGMGLAETIELARALRQLPQRCIVYAIEGDRFDIGATVSLPVAASVRDVALRIVTELEPPVPVRKCCGGVRRDHD